MRFALVMASLTLAQLAFAHDELPGENKSQVSKSSGLVNEKVLRTNKALKDYNEKYLAAPDNKAFAQSPDGHWNWRSDRVTIEMAIEDALAGCNKHLRVKESACVIVNVNGEWVQPPQ